MSDTIFQNGVTVIDAAWANDVNRLNYTTLGNPADLSELKVTVGLPTKAELEGSISQDFAANNITVAGTVDGRDVSADGATLDSQAQAAGNINNPLVHLRFRNGIQGDYAGTLSVGRTTVGSQIDRYGIVQDLAIDEPSHGKYGLREWAQSENLCLHSDSISNAAWVRVNATVAVGGLVAPDGVSAADIFNRSAGGFAVVEQTGLAVGAGVNVTVQGWLYGDGTTFDFGGFDVGGLTTGHTIGVTPPSGQWRWYSLSWVTVAGTTSVNVQPVRDVSGTTASIGVWRVGVELSSYPTVGIKTTTVQVTRTADTRTLPAHNNAPEVDSDQGLSCLVVTGVEDAANNTTFATTGSGISFIKGHTGWNTGTVQVQFGDGTTAYTLPSWVSGSKHLSQQRVTAVMEGTTGTVSVGGVVQGTVTGITRAITTTAQALVNPSNTQTDDIRVYESALTPEEVRLL